MIEAVFTSNVDEITVHGLTQWDKGRKLQITLSSLPASFEVHFANKRAENAYVVDATASNGVAIINIPNAILRNPVDAMAWIYLVNGEAGETVKTIHLPIERRTKPADYVYEEAEIANFREIVNQRIDDYIESGVIVPGASAEEVTKIKEFTINQVEFEHTGNPAQFESFSGCPLNCLTRIEPAQAGSGEPSPSNIRPISGRTGAKLTRCGKNLLPNVREATETYGGITFTNHGDGSYTLDGTATTYVQFVDTASFWLAPGTYVLSGGYGATSQLRSADGLTAFGHSDGSPFTFNVATEVRFRQTLGAGSVFNGRRFYPQLELGSTATRYEPYQGETFSASFGQTVYGGTLDWNTGVLTVDRAIVTLTGTESFQFSSGGTGRFVYYGLQNVIKPFSNSAIVAPIVCSHYKPSTAEYLYNTPDAYAIAQNNGTEIWFSDTGFDSQSAFKAYLSAQNAAGTPVQVCYKLANPTTIQLTPAQLTALQGMNNIFCDAGETTASGRKDILWLTDYLLKRVKELESAVATLETAAVNNV